MKSNKKLHYIVNFVIMLLIIVMSVIAIGNALSFLAFPPSRHAEIAGFNATHMVLNGIGGQLLLSFGISAVLIFLQCKKWMNLDTHKKLLKVIFALCISSEAIMFLSFLSGIYRYCEDHFIFSLMLTVYILPILCEYFLARRIHNTHKHRTVVSDGSLS